VGLAALAALCAVARPLWQGLVFVLEDPFPGHGAVVVSFISERPDEVRVLPISDGKPLEPRERSSGRSYTVTGPRGRGTKSAEIVSAPAGRHEVVLRYWVGAAAEPETFVFDIQLIAQSQCDVLVVFGEQGPRASACTNPRPASYGGTWRH
jgi:hypothetical protein